MTVAKTFALAIEEANNLHPASKQLMEYAALAAPDPLPLSMLTDDEPPFGDTSTFSIDSFWLDEGLATLRTFALIDRGRVSTTYDQSVTMDAVTVHLLVRDIVTVRCRLFEKSCFDAPFFQELKNILNFFLT